MIGPENRKQVNRGGINGGLVDLVDRRLAEMLDQSCDITL
jgi:hypothetical protein